MKFERGMTITEKIMDQAKKESLPDEVMAEIWPGNTLNKAAVERIAKALKKAAKPVAKKKEGDK